MTDEDSNSLLWTVNAGKREEMQEETNRNEEENQMMHTKEVGLCGTDFPVDEFYRAKRLICKVLVNLPLNKQRQLVETVAVILLFLYLLF